MPGSLRKLGKRLAHALASTLISLGVCEGALRIGVVHNARYAEVAAREAWYAGPHRVLILGDSFLVPYGLTGRLLSEQLAASDVALRNLAVSGTGPFEYQAALADFADEPGPDLVVLGFYAGNDLTDVQDNPRYSPTARGTAIRRRPAPPKSAPVTGSWYRRLYLSQFFGGNAPAHAPEKEDSFPWKQFEAAGMDLPLIEEARANRINPYLPLLALRNSHHLLDNVLIETEQNRKAWDKVEALLGQIHDQCRARGARLLVVVFPRDVQVDDRHFEFFRKLHFEVDARTLTSTRPQDLLAKFCERRGIPMLDLLPVLKAHPDQEFFLPKDDHFSVAGHQRAAGEIFRFVVAQAAASGAAEAGDGDGQRRNHRAGD